MNGLSLSGYGLITQINIFKYQNIVLNHTMCTMLAHNN